MAHPSCRFSPRWPGLWGQLRTDADWVHLSESLARGAAAGGGRAGSGGRGAPSHLGAAEPRPSPSTTAPLARIAADPVVQVAASVAVSGSTGGSNRSCQAQWRSAKSSAIMDPHRGHACALTRTSTRPSRRSRRELLSPRLFITPMRATLARLRGAHRNVAELGAITGVDTPTFGPTCATAPPGRGGR